MPADPPNVVHPRSFIEQMADRKREAQAKADAEAAAAAAVPQRTILLSDRLMAWVQGIPFERRYRGLTELEVAHGLGIRRTEVAVLLLSEGWQYRWPTRLPFTMYHDPGANPIRRGVLPRLWWAPIDGKDCGIVEHAPGEPEYDDW